MVGKGGRTKLLQGIKQLDKIIFEIVSVNNVLFCIRFLPELKSKLLQEAKLNYLSKFRDNNKEIEQIKDEKRIIHINMSQNGPVTVKVRIIYDYSFKMFDL